jgi:hypothetical protein
MGEPDCSWSSEGRFAVCRRKPSESQPGAATQPPPAALSMTSAGLHRKRGMKQTADREPNPLVATSRPHAGRTICGCTMCAGMSGSGAATGAVANTTPAHLVRMLKVRNPGACVALRGGSRGAELALARCASRFGCAPEDTRDVVGFRVVLESSRLVPGQCSPWQIRDRG